MKFKEQFPSLYNSEEFDIDDRWVFKEFISKHCLDKQRVREVIDKVFNIFQCFVIIHQFKDVSTKENTSFDTIKISSPSTNTTSAKLDVY